MIKRMKRPCRNAIAGVFAAGLLIAGGFSEDVRAGEDRGLTLHHQAAGLTVTLTTQPSPPRAGENLLRVDLTDVQGQPIPHAQVRLVLTQAFPMPGMHPEPSREIEATSTHVGGHVGRIHLATPGRWEVIVKVVRPGRPATQALFYLTVEPS
ncbi:MAG TPA: FixH family protein [Alphaproteobacteria bacterium]|nr:FixH family protein [Alphaproteobacteria bacterium]